MINLKVDNKGNVKRKIRIAGPVGNLAEYVIAMIAIGETLNEVGENKPEAARKVKADCVMAFTMAANGAAREEIIAKVVTKSLKEVRDVLNR